MEGRKSNRTIKTKSRSVKTVASAKGVKGKRKSKKMNVKPMIIVDWTFLISLALSIIFGIQTNTAVFFVPFTITLAITLVCMGIILVNSIYCKIKKRFSKKSDI